jgi:RNA polymerase sigma-70 factor (ECF subfamily)
LTLRTLGGLTTEEIARALLTPEPTIAQRIVRAKQKIREAKIPYVVPTAAELPDRLETVLTVVYLVFNEGYSSREREGLSAHAIRLGEMLAELMPGEAEVLGLLALMQLHDARRASRYGPGGEFVPLEEQDRRLWDMPRIEAAAALLDRAVALRRRGSYQIQAAIAALHATAPSERETDWRQIALLYEALARVAGTPVVALNHAAAVAMADGPEAGLALLEPLAADPALASYPLLLAARADLLRRAGRTLEAVAAYEAAIAIAPSPRDRAYLTRRLGEVRSAGS